METDPHQSLEAPDPNADWIIEISLAENKIRYIFPYIEELKDALKDKNFTWGGKAWSLIYAKTGLQGIIKNLRKMSGVCTEDVHTERTFGKGKHRFEKKYDTINHSAQWAEIADYLEHYQAEFIKARKADETPTSSILL